MQKKGSIGVFDSGLGGLTVIKELLTRLPGEQFVYLGDTARVPYGTKSKEAVLKFSLQDADFLNTFNLKALIIACNTASSYAYEILQKKYSFPVLNVIEPAVHDAVKQTKTGIIGVIGTYATIRSRAYEKEIACLDKNIKVFSCACPLFVPLVEEGWNNHKITVEIAKEYLNYFKDKHIDTLILGCTHYPLLKPLLAKIMGNSVTLIDTAISVVNQLNNLLEKYEAFSFINKPDNKYFVTDVTQNLVEVSRGFLGVDDIAWEKIDLDSFLMAHG